MLKVAAFKAIPKPIWVLGIVSLLMDLSSEMIHSLLPVFIITDLGASVVVYGVIEGLAESIALITKVFSGVLSDFFGKRKLLATLGYGLSALTKPFFPLSNSIESIVFARFTDRVGKGIRGAPRDALIGELAPVNLRGASFGLRQTLDSVGAFAGPIVAIALMYLFLGNMRKVFWVACLPALAAVGLIVFGVSEPERSSISGASQGKFKISNIKQLSLAFWIINLLAFVFTLARFSEGFLVLRASSLGLSESLLPLVFIIMNVAYSLSSYPAGAISDRMGRKGLLISGLVFLLMADLILAFSASLYVALIGIVFWGLHMGFTQGVVSALLTDHAPKNLLGSAFGVLNLSMGMAVLVSSVIAGLAWDFTGPTGTFLIGGFFSIIALLGFQKISLKA